MKSLSSLIALSIFILAGTLSANFVLATEKIDINSAPLEDLIKIVHIGEVRAKELISLRPFSSLDDLAKIKGIGRLRVDDIKKQGLAWAFEEPTENSSPPPAETGGTPKTKNSQAIPAGLSLGEQMPQTLPFPLFIPLAVAILSGIVVLMLKNKLK